MALPPSLGILKAQLAQSAADSVIRENPNAPGYVLPLTREDYFRLYVEQRADNAALTASSRKLADEVTRLREDKARLDWLIKQGPPGATEGEWLSEAAWDLATMFASEERTTDAEAFRAAIDYAMSPQPKGGSQ